MTTYLMTFIDHNGNYYKDVETGALTKKILEDNAKKGLAIVLSCERVGAVK